MVFIHGGSWIRGDKSNLRKAPLLIQWFLQRGFVVAAPNFRRATLPGASRAVTYREQAMDIAYALAWLHQHVAEYEVTETGILLVGYSSGAHLAALITTDTSYLNAVGLSPREIQGVILLDVHAYDVPYALKLMKGSIVAHNIPLIRHLFGATEEQQRLASPAYYAPSAPVPPTLIISVGPSSVVGSVGYITFHAAQHYAQVLRNSGHRVVWKHFDHEDHSSLVLDFGTPGDGPTEAVARFLKTLWP